MNLTWNSRVLGLVGPAALVALGVFVTPMAGQSAAEKETNRFLKGAIDMHFHMDPPAPASRGTRNDSRGVTASAAVRRRPDGDDERESRRLGRRVR